LIKKLEEKEKILNLIKLDEHNSRLIDEIAKNIQLDYINFLSALGSGNERKVDWWVLNFVSRNTFISNLFRNVCYLLLVKKNLESGITYNEIIVGSIYLKNLLRKFCQENGSNTKVIYKGKKLLYLYLKRNYNYIKVLLNFFYRWFASWIVNKDKKGSSLNGDIILIDTFVHKNDFVGNIYKSHYYPRLFNYLNSEEKKYIYFVPEYYGVKNYVKLFIDIRNCKQKFLLKEDYLKLKDYFFALLFPFRIKLFQLGKKSFKGFNIFPLIKGEIFNDCASSSSMCGLLNYRFAERLKGKDIKLKTIINWFENQAIDHGFNIGFRLFYPKTILKGYLGFPAHNNYLSLYPTEQEVEARVIPNEINVIGKGYINLIKKFSHNLTVKAAPAFRYINIWRKMKYSPSKNFFSLLIALPMLVDQLDEIIDLMLKVAESNKINKKYVFKIKVHPTQNIEFLKQRWKGRKLDKFKFIRRDFQECLDEADVLITYASSVCLETIARGIPVIVLANRLGLTQLPIPENLKQNIWKLCYTPEDIIKSIEYYAKIDKSDDHFKKIGHEVRKNFFEPVTKKSVRKFLGIQ